MKSKKIEVSAYYFPNFHSDVRNEQWHGKGWNEWELVKSAKPRFEGHDQPKIPLWGYEDESDPKVMAKKIKVASESGIDNFIFDWYWYEDGPFLERALNEGFLKAKNCSDIHFSLMWANHDWTDIHPAQRSVWTYGHQTLKYGEVKEQTFIEATNFMISHYFCQKNYYRIEGGCYVSFYMLAGLISGLGGVKETARVLNEFRKRAKEKGFKLHLNAIIWGEQILPGEKRACTLEETNDLLEELGFDSVSSYVWVHHYFPDIFPRTDYSIYKDICEKLYKKMDSDYRKYYFPNVTMGWDASPRTVQSDVYDNVGYPWCPVLVNNTPKQFESALERMKEYLLQRDGYPMFTINAWNEWTEGSYLEPDTKNGYGYLNAIKKVFKEQG